MVAATIKGCAQVGIDEWQNYTETYTFPETATIADILKCTGQKDICSCNLSMVKNQLGMSGRKLD